MSQTPTDIDQSLVQAYQLTDYYLPSLGICIQIGHHSPTLDEYLAGQAYTCGVFITAYNPRSLLLTKQENRQRQRTLEAELTQRSLPYIVAIHRDPRGQWPDERACFILGLKADAAIKLGRHHGQNAVVSYQLGRVAELWWCR